MPAYGGSSAGNSQASSAIRTRTVFPIRIDNFVFILSRGTRNFETPRHENNSNGEWHFKLGKRAQSVGTHATKREEQNGCEFLILGSGERNQTVEGATSVKRTGLFRRISFQMGNNNNSCNRRITSITHTISFTQNSKLFGWWRFDANNLLDTGERRAHDHRYLQ